MEVKNVLEEAKNNLHKFELCTVKEKDKKIFMRPETPCIDFFEGKKNSELASNELNSYFSLFMKRIVDTINSDFLSGKINVIEFMLSKLTNIDIKNIKSIEKLAIKLNHEMDILNQIGQRLVNLTDLRLNGSNIISIANIGTNFSNLISLQVNNCNITDLSGILNKKFIKFLNFIKFFDFFKLKLLIFLRNNLLQKFRNFRGS